MKQHHHISIDAEFRFDCEIWKFFLENYRNKAVCRPMVDLQKVQSAQELNFTSDASAARDLGMGSTFNNYWLFAKWESRFIEKYNPSIKYLGLLGVTAAILTWGFMLENCRIVIFCNNQAVVAMINNMTSSYRNCMYLLHLITLNNLIHNRRVFAKFIPMKSNDLSDALSRMQFNRFWNLVKSKDLKMNPFPSKISHLVWPVSNIWQREQTETHK